MAPCGRSELDERSPFLPEALRSIAREVVCRCPRFRPSRRDAVCDPSADDAAISGGLRTRRIDFDSARQAGATASPSILGGATWVRSAAIRTGLPPPLATGFICRLSGPVCRPVSIAVTPCLFQLVRKLIGVGE